MTTLSVMRSRIASEIRRSNVNTQIDAAIATAVAAYQHERFAFNITRAFTFLTVANTEFYTSSDDADLGNIIKFDYVKLYVGNQPYTLRECEPDKIEALSQNGTQTGQPLEYLWYAEALRLYPVPDQVYTVRVGCVKKVAAPASDAETGNPWMTTAERLIRSRAKYELYMHVLKDMPMALAFDPEGERSPTAEAFNQLKKAANQLAQQGSWAVTPCSF